MPINVPGGTFAVFDRYPSKDIILVVRNNRGFSNSMHNLVMKGVSNEICIPRLSTRKPEIRYSRWHR